MPKTSNVWEKVNVAKPLWMRSPKEVEASEYEEFYKTTFKAYDTPDAHVHFSLEGQVEEYRYIYTHTHTHTHMCVCMYICK